MNHNTEATDFRGFNGENMELIKECGAAGHDHLIIKCDGKKLGNFHLQKTRLDFFAELNNKMTIIHIP